MAPEGLDEAREAFAQEIPQATRERDSGGRFVSTSKPEAIFQPREIEGDERGDTSDGGADPRFLEQERRIADGRSEEREREPVPKPAKRSPAPANDNDQSTQDEPPERIGEEPDDADQDGQKPDKGAGPDGSEGEDASPRYKIQVDGEEREVSLNEALRGYQREETFNHRMRQMVEVAKTIDERGAQANHTREAYIQLCERQEQEFAALIPKEPDWDQLYRQDPAAARQLEQNYKAVYGTLNQIRQRRAQAQQEAYNDNAQRTAAYARAEFDKFRARNKLANQTEVDNAIGAMRRTAASHGFSEDEIGTTYDERMLSVLLKASKYDKMVANKPFPVQPERGGALQPGSAPRVGNGAARSMNDAQKRLAATGRVDDAAAVMAQFLGHRR
jgi:hypothetical protein